MAMNHFRIHFENKPDSCEECVLWNREVKACNLNFSSTSKKGCPIQYAQDRKAYYMPDNCFTCMFLEPDSACRLTGEKLKDLSGSGEKCPILWIRKYRKIEGKDQV